MLSKNGKLFSDDRADTHYECRYNNLEAWMTQILNGIDITEWECLVVVKIYGSCLSSSLRLSPPATADTRPRHYTCIVGAIL